MDALPGLRFRGFYVPESQLEWSFDTPGGPGGQHANRTSSRVTLALDVAACDVFPESTRERLVAQLGDRLKQGVLTITVDTTRSQWRNRALARRRMTETLQAALQPTRRRRPTRPTGASRRRRLEEKRRRSETKRLRRRPQSGD